MYLKFKTYWWLISRWNPAPAPAPAGFALQIRQHPALAGFPKSKSGTALVTTKCVFDVVQAAIERGERLGELEERTAQMRTEAEEFSKAAHQLKNKYRDKKWYQLWDRTSLPHLLVQPVYAVSFMPVFRCSVCHVLMLTSSKRT